MIDIGTTLRYYKRADIQAEMLRASRGKEVAVKYRNGGFGRRPDALAYPGDIIEFAKQGVISFHVSEEHWSDVFELEPDMPIDALERLRVGWDLVLDIDCEVWEYSKLTGKLLVDALCAHGVHSISCKFSGNKGFHIGVPFGAFPAKIHHMPIKHWFPNGAKRIAAYLTDYIRPELAAQILRLHTIPQIMELTHKPYAKLTKDDIFDPLTVIKVDTILISQRHLYRMPYSLHEKSGLCSVPIDPDTIMIFDKVMAKPKNVTVSEFRFLDARNSLKAEAKALVIQAFDFVMPAVVDTPPHQLSHYQQTTTAKVPEELFPPCIKHILAGLKDGRKRSMFILINFLSNSGYGFDEISNMLAAWNTRNTEPLRDVLIRGQIRYRNLRKNTPLPPNCDNHAYYKDMGICHPDNTCNRIKNPVSYPKYKGMRHKHKR